MSGARHEYDQARPTIRSVCKGSNYPVPSLLQMRASYRYCASLSIGHEAYAWFLLILGLEPRRANIGRPKDGKETLESVTITDDCICYAVLHRRTEAAAGETAVTQAGEVCLLLPDRIAAGARQLIDQRIDAMAELNKFADRERKASGRICASPHALVRGRNQLVRGAGDPLLIDALGGETSGVGSKTQVHYVDLRDGQLDREWREICTAAYRRLSAFDRSGFEAELPRLPGGGSAPIRYGRLGVHAFDFDGWHREALVIASESAQDCLHRWKRVRDNAALEEAGLSLLNSVGAFSYLIYSLVVAGRQVGRKSSITFIDGLGFVIEEKASAKVLERRLVPHSEIWPEQVRANKVLASIVGRYLDLPIEIPAADAFLALRWTKKSGRLVAKRVSWARVRRALGDHGDLLGPRFGDVGRHVVGTYAWRDAHLSAIERRLIMGHHLVGFDALSPFCADMAGPLRNVAEWWRKFLRDRDLKVLDFRECM